MQLIWPRSTRFLSWTFALACFALYLVVIIGVDVWASQAEIDQCGKIDAQFGPFRAELEQGDRLARAHIDQHCRLVAEDAGTGLPTTCLSSIPFAGSCSALIAVRALLIAALALESMAMAATFALACFARVPTIVAESAALMAAVATVAGITAFVLTLVISPSGRWRAFEHGPGFSSLAAAWAMGLLNTAILIGVAAVARREEITVVANEVPSTFSRYRRQSGARRSSWSEALSLQQKDLDE